MLRRIKLIQGVGNHQRTIASGIALKDVNIIYGENRNGKSTLCDVLHSLQMDDPSMILDRRTIPDNPAYPPKVELQFETKTGNLVAKFEKNLWQVRTPNCSKLYVFDHSFIHRNVITGLRPERKNSENVTSFILGEENTVLYQEVEQLNVELRKERDNLRVLDKQLAIAGVKNPKVYAHSVLPEHLEQQLQTDADNYKKRQIQIENTIKDADVIRARRLMETTGEIENFTETTDGINALLVKGLKDIHKDTLSSLENHIAEHTKEPAEFKSWARQGLDYLQDNKCPFCAQMLETDASVLIAKYQQAFNREFDQFNSDIRMALEKLRAPFGLKNILEIIEQRHISNIELFDIYPEPEVSEDLRLSDHYTTLDLCYKNLVTCYKELEIEAKRVADIWKSVVQVKNAAPYDALDKIDFSTLLKATDRFNHTVNHYWRVIGHINVILEDFKKSVTDPQRRKELEEVVASYKKKDDAIRRVRHEPICFQYRQKQKNIAGLEEEYRAKKKLLDTSQSDYLATYFDNINRLFVQLGSNDFEIIKVPNNLGIKVVYDLRVKFRGEEISVDKMNYVFSESDRRALSLCIFMAKILSLPEEERSKAVIVLDDPVTSFDNERISLILNKLYEIQGTVKQILITTHYKDMAAKAVKKFQGNVQAINLVNGGNGCEFRAVEDDKMTATDHDVAFDRLKAFVNRHLDENIITELRPFFEEELRCRYKNQLCEIGAKKLGLSACITTLFDNGYISRELEGRLHSLRDSLNAPMHELGSSSKENARAIAGELLEVVYNGLTP